MRVIELLEALAEMPEDAEVRLASQPAWPMEFRLDGPVFVDEAQIARSPGDDWPGAVVYLTEAEHLGYLPGFVARELGWR